MNPNWSPADAAKHPYVTWKVSGATTGGWDQIVECENCGWTWWVHHA